MLVPGAAVLPLEASFGPPPSDGEGNRPRVQGDRGPGCRSLASRSGSRWVAGQKRRRIDRANGLFRARGQGIIVISPRPDHKPRRCSMGRITNCPRCGVRPRRVATGICRRRPRGLPRGDERDRSWAERYFLAFWYALKRARRAGLDEQRIADLSISASLDMRTVLQEAHDGACALTGTRYGFVVTVNDDAPAVRMETVAGAKGNPAFDRRTRRRSSRWMSSRH